MGFLTTFRPSWAKWDCCSGCLFDSCFTHNTNSLCTHTFQLNFHVSNTSCTGNHVSTVPNQQMCLKTCCIGMQKWVKTVERFKNNEGSMRGWLQSSGTVFLQTTLKFFYLLVCKLRSLHESGFCVCGGFIARKPCDCSSARFSQVTKWDSENKKQAKYFENGNSNKWDLGQHFRKQGTKWDPSLSRDYCNTTG